MAGLIRQGHFLGAKLRSLRKRNGLTLDELSARCVQIDAAGAPSVSYLSMVETGKRMPSPECSACWQASSARMCVGFSTRTPKWRCPPAARTRRPRCHAARAGILVFARAAAKRAARTPVSDRHHRAPICAAIDPGLAGDPPQQFSGHRARRRRGRQATDAPDARRRDEICASHGLEIRWFDGDSRKPSGALVRSRFEAPGTVFINKRLRTRKSG